MMKANVMSAPQADAPTKESAKSSLNEARTRVLLGVRSLQPREWIEQVRSTLEGYTNFVRMTLTSRNEGVSG